MSSASVLAGRACHYGWIDTVARAADAAGLDYWGVVQTLRDPAGGRRDDVHHVVDCGTSRLPTAVEIDEQFVHWRATRMTGYLGFAWRWPSGDSTLWLANHPELQAQLKIENGG